MHVVGIANGVFQRAIRLGAHDSFGFVGLPQPTSASGTNTERGGFRGRTACPSTRTSPVWPPLYSAVVFVQLARCDMGAAAVELPPCPQGFHRLAAASGPLLQPASPIETPAPAKACQRACAEKLAATRVETFLFVLF